MKGFVKSKLSIKILVIGICISISGIFMMNNEIDSVDQQMQQLDNNLDYGNFSYNDIDFYCKFVARLDKKHITQYFRNKQICNCKAYEKKENIIWFNLKDLINIRPFETMYFYLLKYSFRTNIEAPKIYFSRTIDLTNTKTNEKIRYDIFHEDLDFAQWYIVIEEYNKLNIGKNRIIKDKLLENQLNYQIKTVDKIEKALYGFEEKLKLKKITEEEYDTLKNKSLKNLNKESFKLKELEYKFMVYYSDKLKTRENQIGMFPNFKTHFHRIPTKQELIERGFQGNETLYWNQCKDTLLTQSDIEHQIIGSIK